MITTETLERIAHRHLRHLEKEYSGDSEKLFSCLEFHLYNAALRKSLQNPDISELVKEIDETFDSSHECPEGLTDTSSCHYAKLIYGYAVAIIKEFERSIQDGNP